MERKRKPHPGASALGRLSAAARMKKISPEDRKRIARHAVTVRWAKAKAKAKRTTT